MEPTADQLQLLSVEPDLSARLPDRVPTHADIVLTAEQLQEAAREWPDKSPAQQAAFMKQRILIKLKNEIVIDQRTGRRLFGGPQPGSGAKKKRIGQVLVEAVDERQKEVIDAAFAPLSPKNPNSYERHRTAMNLTKEAREERALEMAEDELDRASDKDVLELALGIVKDMLASGDLSIAELLVQQVVDATVVE